MALRAAKFTRSLNSMLPEFDFQPIISSRRGATPTPKRVAVERAAWPTHHHLINRSLPISNCVQSGTRWKVIPRLAGCAHRGQTSSGVVAAILLRPHVKAVARGSHG
jgi:hypothetical protein